MCGLAGIFAYRHDAPPVDREELLRIREAMINRGPDGAGLGAEGSAERRAAPYHYLLRRTAFGVAMALIFRLAGINGKLAQR